MSVDENSDEIQKSKKNDSAERPYGCPCGKKYLSYPALFTHVKQKHQGKPPGQLIKPKTEKARGRPRLNSINNQSEGEQSTFDFQDQISRVISNASLNRNYQFQTSDGKISCNDMMSSFLNSYKQMQVREQNILKGFCCYVKTVVQKKYGNQYWSQESPSQIIDCANQLVKQLNSYHDNFPLEKKLVTDLVFILFKWMYRNKWTDHKLIRRSSDALTTIQ